MSNLQTLGLGGTQIGELPDSIGRLSNLQSLDLSGCHLKEIPYGVVKLGLRFVIDDNFPIYNCVNLTGVTLDEGDITFENAQNAAEIRGRLSQGERPAFALAGRVSA